MTHNMPNMSTSRSSVGSLKFQLRELERLLQRCGYLTHGKFSNYKLQRLSGAQLKRLEAKITDYCSILKMSLTEADQATASRSLFWIACRYFNFRPLADFLNLIDDGDVIEIYSLDNRQIFCSCSFWSLVSYSIHDIFLKEFWELYSRESSVNEQISRVLQKTILDQKTVAFGKEQHVMHEASSPLRYSFLMRLGYASPLFDRTSGQISAFACSAKAIRLSSPGL